MNRKYLLPQDGQTYKANLHCHTTISDGKCTPEEIAVRYREKRSQEPILKKNWQNKQKPPHCAEVFVYTAIDKYILR